MHICPPFCVHSRVNETKDMNTPPPFSSINRQRLKASNGIMRALAHPLRIQMIHYLDEQETACVNNIFEALEIKQAVASQHLRVLRQAELVYTKRQGKFIYYALHYDRIELAARAARIV